MSSLDCMLTALAAPVSFIDGYRRQGGYLPERGNRPFAVTIAMETASQDSGYFGDRILA